MDEIPPHAPPSGDSAERSCQFKGIRLRKWGSWVAEIRMPRSRQKLWLGSYTTAEQAARAFDAAVYCIRGPNAVFNFPNSLPSIPSASSLSRREIKLAAAKYATLEDLPAISPSANENANANTKKRKDLLAISPSANENANANKKKRKDAALPSSSTSVPETVFSLSDSQHQQEFELALWENLVAESGDWLAWKNLERFPSIWEEVQEQHHEEEEMSNFDNFTDLWNFDDV